MIAFTALKPSSILKQAGLYKKLESWHSAVWPVEGGYRHFEEVELKVLVAHGMTEEGINAAIIAEETRILGDTALDQLAVTERGWQWVPVAGIGVGFVGIFTNYVSVTPRDILRVEVDNADLVSITL